MNIRTRFAPSPTGFLHIGGVRTALFNYLFARHHGGQYLLRIEDTDRARNSPEAVQAILDGLAWLGLSPDEPPVFQSARVARHAEVAHQMLAAGTAYRCWATPEELKAMREAAIAAGTSPRYDGRWRDRDPAEAPAGATPAIRLKAPHDGETIVHDLVQGTVRVANAEMDDLVILRADGTPTYLHAVVVDDHDMAISHVIRGDDHLTNTFRQVQIFNAMGWDLPQFAHIPLIHGADGSKLSKRHGAVSALELADQGFLPEAVCNYLLRLGWAHGDDEIFSPEEAIALFDLDAVNRGAARMDYAKLTHVNGVWIRRADDQRLIKLVLDWLTTNQVISAARAREPIVIDRIRALMPALKERAKTIAELAESCRPLTKMVFEVTMNEEIVMEDRAAALLTPEARRMLSELATELATTEFTQSAIDATLRAFAERTGRKLGQVAQPLRAALTGTTVSPGIDATLTALGKEEALARIAAAAR